MPSPRPCRARLTRKIGHGRRGEAQQVGDENQERGRDQQAPRADAGLQIARAGAARNGEGQKGRRAPAELLGIAELQHDARHDRGDEEPAERLDRDAGADGPDGPRAPAEEQLAPAGSDGGRARRGGLVRSCRLSPMARQRKGSDFYIGPQFRKQMLSKIGASCYARAMTQRSAPRLLHALKAAGPQTAAAIARRLGFTADGRAPASGPPAAPTGWSRSPIAATASAGRPGSGR